MLPENKFPPTYDEWEEVVFKNASHFTVYRFLGSHKRDKATHYSLIEAINDAGDDVRALVYAVTASGQAVCLPRSKWPHFAKLEKAGIAERRVSSV
jgi:hypothetical protein